MKLFVVATVLVQFGLLIGCGGAPSTTTPSLPSANDASISITNHFSVLTYHNDNARTGQNLTETILTPSNVNAGQFGKLFSYPVDGYVYAQPLYVANLNIPNQGPHNVVYVATEGDSVYAFDADGRTRSPLWQESLIDNRSDLTPVPGSEVGSGDDTAALFLGPEVGITGTPVIDPDSGTLYVVTAIKQNGHYAHRLHALDITTGVEKFGGPVGIEASVPGIGDGNDSVGQVLFNSFYQLQRSGLLLSKGVVYIGFGSYGDVRPFHGWLIGYDAKTLRQAAVFNPTPNDYGGSIWQSGGAPAADADGNIFIITSNGGFDANTGGADFGDSFLKLVPSAGGLTPSDYFTPFDQSTLASSDTDLGSGGALLLPDQAGLHPHLLLGSGKDGIVYLLDRDSLGHFNPVDNSQIVQSITANRFANFSTPAYWNSNVYLARASDYLRDFQIDNGLLTASPVSQSTSTLGLQGATPAISANGATSSGIVWVLEVDAFGPGGAPPILHAYDATNVATELYNSNQAGTRDLPGPAVKFAVPTIGNGKVYVGTQNQITVFGLLQ